MRFLSLLFITIVISGCGGGGSDESDKNNNSPSETSAASELNPTPASPTILLSLDAPNNNLDLSAGKNYETTTATYRCGFQLPSKSITGTVTSVHDGDTIKIGTTNIRLDAIDAPELPQAYGTQSRDNLVGLVIGKYVTVYYSKIDKYGRTVGSVITSDCTYVNLQQVRSGSAWHYKQYQCEQSAELRSQFSSAQDSAAAEERGLWAFVSVPPWVFRNGVDTEAPMCSSDRALWNTGTISTPGSPPSPTYIPVTSCSKVWVNGYRRANGTYVSGYWRNSPGCA